MRAPTLAPMYAPVRWTRYRRTSTFRLVVRMLPVASRPVAVTVTVTRLLARRADRTRASTVLEKRSARVRERPATSDTLTLTPRRVTALAVRLRLTIETVLATRAEQGSDGHAS